MNKRLVIISGVRGKMGNAFFNNFKELPHTTFIGLTSDKNAESKVIKQVDLFDKNKSKQFISDLNISDFQEVYYIHSIGVFLFEKKGLPNKDINKDGIDDFIYASNFESFQNFVKPLIKKINEKPNIHKPVLTLCAFGSISDRYLVPWWQSYSKTKNILKAYMRELVNGKTRCLFINVSSTEKEGERPLADKTYWLTCQEVADATMRALFDYNLYWQEVDIFKPNPKYYSGFFLNHEKLKERWLHDIGKNNSVDKKLRK